MKGNLEYSEFRDFADKFNQAMQQPNFLIDTTIGIRDNTVRRLKMATPIGNYNHLGAYRIGESESRGRYLFMSDEADDEKDPGQLRRGWDASAVFMAGDTFRVNFENDVDYAIWVEEGHSYLNTQGGTGWITGRFMMRDTMEALGATYANVVRRRYNKYLRGFFDG